ncbi:TPA: spermidine/putrescine ABC transporter permease PotC [Candidatus Dependentiae bacterium]|nr:MAG: Putrescine transport system permease protein potI [candidate division TM6 bacterium GW2011_GWF2_36_131]KKQ03446.1 MAG: Putrescine transport system permease protein potI [candidate division TM6 bacterium GW2011_GWE2_36_25]KKQ20280.1 MAG: Putrescine transport system permease protein potI [candidate division TM6 bacterium GW2011_GWA2_36_9]HBR70820.1 spermidine/putrescine ABC transporter permease PotC [Candidatus Dependentiae bacterium]HCU00205.1 spermidine/putrescine ABC transporter permea
MQLRKYSLPLLVILAYLFLYLPIIVLIVFSFNNANMSYQWHGFTLKWYQELFHSEVIWGVLKNSLIVAGCSTFLSLTLGAMVVYGMKEKLDRFAHIFYIPVLIPEIVLSVGFLYLFSFFRIPLGLPTVIVAHTLLGLAYSVPLLHARLSELDENVIEASMDLGATPWQTFVRIVFPFLRPALLSAGLLAWIVSFDDFLIAFFCTGGSSQTLPLYIYAMVRVGVSPVINALSVLMLVLSCLLVLIYSSIKFKSKDIYE